MEATAQTNTGLKGEWGDLLFGVRRSVRYHLHRRKFFEILKRCVNFIVIISGGTVVSLASSSEPKRIGVIVFGAIAGIVGTLDLVLDFSNKARDHRDLVKAFSDLEAEILKSDVTKQNLDVLTKQRLQIEVDEPAIKHVLNMYCHNELIRAADEFSDDDLADIKWWQSIPKQLIDICPHRIKTFKQIAAAKAAALTISKPISASASHS